MHTVRAHRASVRDLSVDRTSLRLALGIWTKQQNLTPSLHKHYFSLTTCRTVAIQLHGGYNGSGRPHHRTHYSQVKSIAAWSLACTEPALIPNESLKELQHTHSRILEDQGFSESQWFRGTTISAKQKTATELRDSVLPGWILCPFFRRKMR